MTNQPVDQNKWEIPIGVGTETKHYFLCPECKKHKHYYGHVLAQPTCTFGPWYCHERGCGLCVDIQLVDGVLLIRPRPERARWVRKLVLLQRDNVYLIVDHSTFSDVTEGQLQYYFDQHTCPTNYFRATQAILIPPLDNDPHGLFKYVAVAEPTINDIPNTPARVLFEHFGIKVAE